MLSYCHTTFRSLIYEQFLSGTPLKPVQGTCIYLLTALSAWLWVCFAVPDCAASYIEGAVVEWILLQQPSLIPRRPVVRWARSGRSETRAHTPLYSKPPAVGRRGENDDRRDVYCDDVYYIDAGIWSTWQQYRRRDAPPARSVIPGAFVTTGSVGRVEW